MTIAEELKQFVVGLQEATLFVDSDGVVQWANEAARRRLETAAAGVTSSPLDRWVVDEATHVAELLRRWSRTRQPLPGRLHWRSLEAAPSRARCEGFLIRPSRPGKSPLICIRELSRERRSVTDFVALNREIERQRQANRDLRHSQSQLALERDKATVTLYSIGDAVITTDAEGGIERLNRIASQLTGWAETQALGQPLASVFRIVNEETRAPAPDPVRRCLREGRTVGLANHTLLIARDGAEYVIEDSAAPIRGDGGVLLGAVLVFRDVTAQRLARHQLHFLAHHDPLTTLNNRYSFEKQLESAFQRARRGAERHAMIYFDLDQFKLVNDTAGHQVGDQLLIAVARHLSSRVRGGDVLARLGGDEFALLASDIDEVSALKLAEEIVTSLRQDVFQQDRAEYQVGASAGVAPVDHSSTSSAEVMRRADVACYIAKRSGRGVAHLFQEGDHAAIATVSEMELVNDIRAALEEGRCHLVFQPIIQVVDNRTSHYEILLRMSRRDGGEESPVQLIAAAERYGFMGEVDRWVIDTALRELAAQHSRGNRIAFTINLSGTSLGDPNVQTFLVDALDRYGIAPGSVVLEVTETAAVARIEQAAKFMRELRGAGCRFALDDFGTGFSSFAYLKYLPVEYLKIDGTFIRDLVTDPVDQAMVSSITGIASAMGMSTVAECVESEQTLSSLKGFGVAFAQGFFISRPLRVPSFDWGALH